MGAIAILGLGESLNLFDSSKYDLSIGVNDIWRAYKSEAIVCVNPPKDFNPNRLSVINQSKPKAFYSQFTLWNTRPDLKMIQIIPGYPDSYLNLDTPGYYKSYCSPFIACQIAYKIYDATEIHLFGVDLVNHPILKGELCIKIKNHFSLLNKALITKGCQLIVHGEGILTIQL